MQANNLVALVILQWCRLVRLVRQQLVASGVAVLPASHGLVQAVQACTKSLAAAFWASGLSG
jgi:hypothetical protein